MNPFVLLLTLLPLLNVVCRVSAFSQLSAEVVKPTAVFLVDIDSLFDDVIKRGSTNFTDAIESG